MTFMEITVVLVILAVMLAVVIPNLKPFRERANLRIAARNLVAVIRYARGEAIYGHRTVKLRIDVEQGRYRLDLMIDSIPAAERDGDKLRDVEAIRTLPERVYFDKVILYSAADKSRKGIVVLDFSPRGSITPATIVLADERGRLMTVDIFGTTGALEIYPGAPPEETGKGQEATS